MKQTAVEFLLDNLIICGVFDLDKSQIDIIEQAKEMERELLILTHINGQSEFDKGSYRQEIFNNAEQYYNETFKSE
jgi:hypothetical protein